MNRLHPFTPVYIVYTRLHRLHLFSNTSSNDYKQNFLHVNGFGSVYSANRLHLKSLFFGVLSTKPTPLQRLHSNTLFLCVLCQL